jgi:hypothetical protein
MIEEELLDIIRDPSGGADRLGEIVDDFRSGRVLDDLARLLRSDNAELVAIGAWILGELDFELYQAGDFVKRLAELTGHHDPSVRFHALGALFPALDRDDPGTVALLEKLRSDGNEGVRRSAEEATARLSLK